MSADDLLVEGAHNFCRRFGGRGRGRNCDGVYAALVGGGRAGRGGVEGAGGGMGSAGGGRCVADAEIAAGKYSEQILSVSFRGAHVKGGGISGHYSERMQDHALFPLFLVLGLLQVGLTGRDGGHGDLMVILIVMKVSIVML